MRQRVPSLWRFLRMSARPFQRRFMVVRLHLRINHTFPSGDLFTLDAKAGGFDFSQV